MQLPHLQHFQTSLRRRIERSIGQTNQESKASCTGNHAASASEIDQYFCKPIIKRLRNNPQIFTPTHAPTNPPDSPASDTDSIDDLPSPATMKPDYSSGEDYVDIYREYIRSNSHDPESP